MTTTRIYLTQEYWSSRWRGLNPSVRALYFAGTVLIILLLAFFTYVLFAGSFGERGEVAGAVNRFVTFVNAKQNDQALNLIDPVWFDVKNKTDTLAFLEQVEGLGNVKLDRLKTYTTEGVDGTVAYEVAYDGHLGTQSADVSFRLIRHGKVLSIQAFRLE